MGIVNYLREKINPAQPDIVLSQGETQETSSRPVTVQYAYSNIEVVNKGVNLVADSAASISYDVKDPIAGLGIKELSPRKIQRLLNYKPNPFQSADIFKRLIFIDLLVEGNAFLYFDGAHLYNLPACDVTIETNKKTYIDHYLYNSSKKFKPDEVIHIQDNSIKSIFRGDSRILSTLGSIKVLLSMRDFQQNFFDNNAVPGLILRTPNILSDRIKTRILNKWMQDYNPRRGGKRPAILDGDFSLETLGGSDFRELDFAESVKIHEAKILKAIGVPPILLDSGNNANIAPNLKMYYLNTVLPLVEKVTSALERYFGYDIKPNKVDIIALRPDMKEEGAYYSTLVNNGIMTQNEAREKLRLPKSDQAEADELVKPANIAGSASDATQGGAPKKPANEEDKNDK